MSSGCLCCSIRGDLIDTLRRLYKRRDRGEVPKFKRLVIETTGLADPAPILQTLIGDPLLSAFYRLDGVVTTVDAVNGMDQLDRQFESVKQAAVADRLILTKTDLATPDQRAALEARLQALNPAAPYSRSHTGLWRRSNCSMPASTIRRTRARCGALAEGRSLRASQGR
jgi:G3E family GTPase